MKIKRKNLIEIKVNLDFDYPKVKLISLKPNSLQKDLKFISNEDKEKLEKSIIKNGFTSIIFLWKDKKTKETHILDGNHRVMILQNMVKNKAYKFDYIPAVFQKAKTLDEAKKLVLMHSSKYTKISKIAMAVYLEEFEELEEDLVLDLKETFSDSDLEIEQSLNLINEKNEIEDIKPEKEAVQEQDKEPEKFYILIEFETEKERSKELKKIDSKLHYSTATDLDLSFK